MKKTVIILLLGSVFLAGFAQEDLTVNSYWTYNGHMSNSLYDHICSHAFTQLKERRVNVGRLKTEQEWANRQAEAKKIMGEMIGEFPAKTPLKPVITGTIKKEDFVVEKLYFESRPGYYVTAALFMPLTKKGKLPAIIYCCGHSDLGFRHEAYQQCILNLVKKGFIVLAFDPIGQGERVQYFDSNGKSIFVPTREHSYPGSQSFISGRAPANYFIWDGIRAVDYLLTRKEVDPARIGITGRSGGGTQSAYIAAMDERILAAAPECYITSFDKLLRSIGPQDAEQILTGAIKKGFDLSDLIEIRAPKPTLIITTTRDMFSIQGARDVFKEAKNTYTAFGKPENLQMVEDDAVHASTPKNREAMYAFFQQSLQNPGDPKDEEVKYFTLKELWVTPTGQVSTSLNGETLFSLNEKYTAETLRKLQTAKQTNTDFYHDLAQKVKSLTGYSEPAFSKDFIFSGRLLRENISIEKYLIKGAGSYYIPVLRLSLVGHPTNKTILLLDDKGKASAAEKGGLAEQLVQKGYQVIVPDLNGYGELSGGIKREDAADVPMNVWYAGILTHKSLLAVRMEEIKIIVDFINELGPSGTLTGIADGVLSADLLHSAVIDRLFNQIALINPLLSYRSIVEERFYHPKFILSAPAGVIACYDLPDLVAAFAPLRICLLNPVDAINQTVDQTRFFQTYSESISVSGESRNLAVGFDVKDTFLALDQWLE